MFTKSQVAEYINVFLLRKNKEPLKAYSDTLHSSGLLDSLGMFELLMHLNRLGLDLKYVATEDGTRMSILSFDSVNLIVGRLEANGGK